MCGIAGAVGGVDARVRSAVRSMSDAQAHRGPDADGFFENADPGSGLGVALGHRRLSIIDLRAASNQPMRDPASGCVLIFNGEIYNYRELRAELEGRGSRFATESDTEVLLQAFVQWGAECVGRLRGMFAFAVWDPRTRRLFLARDRVGIKPIYYARVERSGAAPVLLFASELRALLASELLERRLDPVALSTYLWNGFVVGPQTAIRGVRLLPPGTSLTVDVDGAKAEERRYWELPSARPGATRPEELGEALAEAVRIRLVADVPLGIFLSGGVDSSAVARLAVAASSGRVKTFTIAFEEAEFDESEHARRVAETLGTEHCEIRLAERRFRDELPAALASLDQPTFDAINTWFVSRATREAGVTVALAGTGGDELFGGYRSFADLPRAQAWSRRLAWLPEPWLRHAAWLSVGAVLGGRGAVPPQTRWGKLGDVLATRGDLVRLYQASYALFTESFAEALRARLGDADVQAGLPRSRLDELRARTRDEPLLHAISMLELTLFLGERLLRDTDVASMAASLEVRVPLVDHVVIERLAGVDLRERFEPLGRKQLLRTLGLWGVDPRLFDRPKSGFVLPIERWCRMSLRDEVQATLDDRALCAAAGLDPAAVARLWTAFSGGAPGIYWSRVWAIFVLLRWCAAHRASM